MNYENLTTSKAVLSYLKNNPPTRPNTLATAIGKPVQSVYTALYQLKEKGKTKPVTRGVWTAVHRAQSKVAQNKTAPETDTRKHYKESEMYQNLLGELDTTSRQLREYKEKYTRLHAIASYLEKRNGQLLAHVWEKGGDISIGVNQ